jgi:hypothetical protein
VLDATNPQKSVMLAVDGPAPLAKLLTQRERRKVGEERYECTAVVGEGPFRPVAGVDDGMMLCARHTAGVGHIAARPLTACPGSSQHPVLQCQPHIVITHGCGV